MLKTSRKIYDWAAQKARSKNSVLWLGIVYLLELVFFLPLDALLMLFCMENPSKRYLYALVAATASVLCGFIGYLLGLFLWDAIGPVVIGHLVSPDFFNRLVEHYSLHQKTAVFVGSLLPIPFKAITLSAGFCKLALWPFITCVFLARILRFFIIAGMMHLWGSKVKEFIDRHFNRIVMAVGAKIALGLAFIWAIGH